MWGVIVTQNVTATVYPLSLAVGLWQRTFRNATAGGPFHPFIRGSTREEIMAYLMPGYRISHETTASIPDEPHVAGKFAYEVGCYLLELYNKA